MRKTQKYDTIEITGRGGFSLEYFSFDYTHDIQTTKQTKERETNMKIKNLAFFGVMASILGVGGAYADNTTVIASKSYVDNKVATKEATANKETGNTLTDSTTLYPSSHTVKAAINAIDVSGQLTNYATNSDLETGLATKVDKDQKTANKDKMMVTDTNGKVAVYDKDDHITLDHQNKLIKISGFQAPIDDLSTIRSGAAAGATAVQPNAISDMETQTHAAATYQPKGNYLTSHQNISGKEDKDNKSDTSLITSADGKITNVAEGDSEKYASTKLLGTDFKKLSEAITKSQYNDSDVRAHISDGDIHVTAAQKTTWSGKQDAISDLATIRSGAAAGATAVQPGDISDMETKTHAAATYQPKGDYQAAGDYQLASDSLVDEAGQYITADNQVGKNLKALDEGLKTVASATEGLKSAAYTESSDYATSAQGAKADTAVQPAAISDMETKTHAAATYQPKGDYQAAGDYQLASDSLVDEAGQYITADNQVGKNLKALDEGLKTVASATEGLKSAAYTESSAYATAAQGAKADTAVQPAAISDMLTQTSAASTYETKTHASETYQPKGDYQLASDSTVEENGNLIIAGHEVAKNLGLLDTKIGKEDMGTEADTLTGAIAEVKGIADGKQDPINDLATIRSNASSAIKGVKLNGTALTADSNGAVNVTSVVEGVATVTGQGEAITAVTEDSNHKVAATKSKLTYAGAMDSSLANINGEGSCDASKPCVLTYNGSDYVWTNMDLGN